MKSSVFVHLAILVLVGILLGSCIGGAVQKVLTGEDPTVLLMLAGANLGTFVYLAGLPRYP